MAAEALGRLGVSHLVLNQRRFAEAEAVFVLRDGASTGVLTVDGVELALEGFGGHYTG